MGSGREGWKICATRITIRRGVTVAGVAAGQAVEHGLERTLPSQVSIRSRHGSLRRYQRGTATQTPMLAVLFAEQTYFSTNHHLVGAYFSMLSGLRGPSIRVRITEIPNK